MNRNPAEGSDHQTVAEQYDTKYKALREQLQKQKGQSMGISTTIMKMGPLELAVDAEVEPINQELVFTISMGTAFTGGNRASVNIETPRMTEAEFRVVLIQFNEALEYSLKHFYGKPS